MPSEVCRRAGFDWTGVGYLEGCLDWQIEKTWPPRVPRDLMTRFARGFLEVKVHLCTQIEKMFWLKLIWKRKDDLELWAGAQNGRTWAKLLVCRFWDPLVFPALRPIAWKLPGACCAFSTVTSTSGGGGVDFLFKAPIVFVVRSFVHFPWWSKTEK